MIGVIPYSTSDTDEAAYLCALGAKTPVLDRTNPKRIVYVFELTEGQMDSVPHFKDGTGKISALAFTNSKKMLFRLMQDGRE